MSKKKNAISPTRQENYPEWYQSVLKAADLAEHSPVRGCMIIKPWGYGIWENIQKHLDRKFKETGHQNAYFPLFIPLSFLEKEAKHVEGFAKECAVVTHHRLEKGKEGGLVPAGKLDEPLIVRPTSEMIIGEAFSRWISSYRDLPVLINQWCNIVRWEMRTRMFLRTTEFLWQEGHTVHATEEEALQEAKQMLQVYVDFCRQKLAMDPISGVKTESERFPGAVETFTFEAMMQDRKAIQCGTSHFLGQNFAKACNIQFQAVSGEREYGWMTSWGTTTRFIGGLVMTHSDDDGLVLPPRIAPSHVVLIPILHSQEVKAQVMEKVEQLAQKLRELSYQGEPLNVIVDDRDLRGGEKSWSWIKKGIPLRLEIGPKEIESDQFMVKRRDLSPQEGLLLSSKELLQKIIPLLEEMQKNLLQKATAFREEHTRRIDTKEEFYRFFQGKEEEISSGFALSHFSLDPKVEEMLKKELSVTVRCIPDHLPKEKGICPFTQKPSDTLYLFAKSY